jgi:hypothetical protein
MERRVERVIVIVYDFVEHDDIDFGRFIGGLHNAPVRGGQRIPYQRVLISTSLTISTTLCATVMHVIG